VLTNASCVLLFGTGNLYGRAIDRVQELADVVERKAILDEGELKAPDPSVVSRRDANPADRTSADLFLLRCGRFCGKQAGVVDWRCARFYGSPARGRVLSCPGLLGWLTRCASHDCRCNCARPRDQIFLPGPSGRKELSHRTRA